MNDRRRRRKTDAAAHRMSRGINDRPLNLGEPRRPQRRLLQPRARQIHATVAELGCCPLGVPAVAWGRAFVDGRA
jgi:hypothetical protein